MQHINLYLRRTFRYADGWASLDQHSYLHTVRAPAPRVIEEDWGGEHAGVLRYTLKVPGQLSRKEHAHIKRAIYHTLGGSSCRHERDCCGCLGRTVSVQRVSTREYSVRVSAYRNY
jgi:hypothetical protein